MNLYNSPVMFKISCFCFDIYLYYSIYNIFLQIT